MRSRLTSLAWLPLVAVAAFALPGRAGAQGFSVDYGISRPAPAAEPVQYGGGIFNLGSVRIGPALQADAQFSGAGLSLAAGQNWFAQVSVGRSLQHLPGMSDAVSTDALRIGGGYRWGDGQSLSLQVTGGRGPQRLGLAASYDWPRYFVRLSYDTGLNPAPQDRVRFSAGVRF